MTVDLTQALPADFVKEEAERRANRGPWGTVHPEHYMHRGFERDSLRDITRPETRDWLSRLVNDGKPCLVRLMWQTSGLDGRPKQRHLVVWSMYDHWDGPAYIDPRYITEDECPPLRHLDPDDQRTLYRYAKCNHQDCGGRLDVDGHCNACNTDWPRDEWAWAERGPRVVDIVALAVVALHVSGAEDAAEHLAQAWAEEGG